MLTILDPAPAPPEGLPESLYHVDILTPNQSEAQLLTGMPVRTIDDARRAAERFLLRGTRIVVIKMGSQGAVIVHARGRTWNRPPAWRRRRAVKVRGRDTVAIHVPGFRVAVVDTTGAGDAFAGALAVGLAEGMSLPEAVRSCQCGRGAGVHQGRRDDGDARAGGGGAPAGGHVTGHSPRRWVHPIFGGEAAERVREKRSLTVALRNCH